MEHILEILHNIWYGLDVDGLQYGLAPLAIAGIVQAGGSLLGGLFGGGAARRAEAAARRERMRLENKLNNLEKNRQAIINPYEGVENLSDLAEDLSGQMSNPYANIGVATQAAEIQIEEADISLANTLDTLQATGASAGGATALAQAALQSKKQVSANIEQQEAQNEKLRAQGEQALQQQKIAEQQRLQGIQMSEGQRIQTAEAAGKQFVFGTQEQREVAEMDRVATQLSGAEARQRQAAADRTSAMTTAIGGIVGGLGSFAEGGGFKKGGSDRRIKKNIKLIGKSKSGLNIYAFEYIDKIFGEGVWQGVMSDEVPSDAVIKNFAGDFDGVDYSKIDVEFKQLSL